MAETVNRPYQLYHPKWHRPRMPIFWWLEKLSYVKFITREMTSLAVGYTAVVLLLQIAALGRGPEAYGRFVRVLETPVVVILHVVVLVFLLFHSFTWLSLAPKAMVLHVGKRRLPDSAILAAHYLAWLAVTGLLIWYLTS